MSKYLIEIHHSADKMECLHAIAILLNSGSHLLTNADWGCYDEVHKAWFFMEADSKEEAMRIVPPAYRKDTVITGLNKFKLKEVEEMMKHHVD
jgi:hypothetical protein